MSRHPLPLLLPLLAAIAALATGCGEPDCDALDPEAGWIELGVGDEAFEPIDDGITLQVERGSQGGMHVWVSVRTGDIQPGSAELWDGLKEGDLPFVEFEVIGDDGILTPDNGRPTVLERADGEYQLLHNLVAFRHFAELPDGWEELDYGEVEAAMEEVDHRVLVRLEDSCGTVIQDEVVVRLDFPPRGEAGGDDDDDDDTDR